MAGRITLDVADQRRAFAIVDSWRIAGAAGDADCVRCGARRMAIVNASTPPHAEWFLLSCAACGLDTMLHRAMGASG
jgi:hypothetical protein